MVYSALTIAEYVLYYAKMKGYGLSSLQLLKILYFVQAQFLVFKKTPAFADKMTAASWGPVCQICLGPVQCLRKCVHPGCKR